MKENQMKYLAAVVLAVVFATLIGEGVQAIGRVTTDVQSQISGRTK